MRDCDLDCDVSRGTGAGSRIDAASLDPRHTRHPPDLNRPRQLGAHRHAGRHDDVGGRRRCRRRNRRNRSASGRVARAGRLDCALREATAAVERGRIGLRPDHSFPRRSFRTAACDIDGQSERELQTVRDHPGGRCDPFECSSTAAGPTTSTQFHSRIRRWRTIAGFSTRNDRVE